MIVKVKEPSKVYFDRDQAVTLTGDKPITVKATYMVRQLLNDGKIVEVVEEPKEPKEPEDKKPVKVTPSKKD